MGKRSQLNVNTAHSTASKMPIPAIRPPININGTTLSSPLRKRRPAHSCRPTPIKATRTNAIFAQNHQVSPLGPPNFSQRIKGPVINRMYEPTSANATEQCLEGPQQFTLFGGGHDQSRADLGERNAAADSHANPDEVQPQKEVDQHVSPLPIRSCR